MGGPKPLKRPILPGRVWEPMAEKVVGSKRKNARYNADQEVSIVLLSKITGCFKSHASSTQCVSILETNPEAYSAAYIGVRRRGRLEY
jgi:hypothetical protein